MILGEGGRMAAAATLDDLFRRAGVRHPDAIALADPPNREKFTDGAPRTMSFAQADRAISAFAAKLRTVGLPTDSIVAVQLPNTVESVIALLGVLRAGMIAAPMPVLWRCQDIVAALSKISAKAIVTSSRIGDAAQAETARQAAVELFSIRHIFGFGADLPDGLVPFDGILAPEGTDTSSAHTRSGAAADHVAAITFGIDATGITPLARNHVELVAGGLELFLETEAPFDAPVLSTIPIGSFAGIALTILPWLLSGGTLHLHHGFDANAFATQCDAFEDGVIVLPGAVAAAIAEAGMLGGSKRTVAALWRAPERLMTAKPWRIGSTLVDVTSFGEIGIVACRRDANSLPAAIPLGVADPSRRAAGAPTVIETTRTGAGTLALRGRMVPSFATPELAHALRLPAIPAGYVDTGLACQHAQGGLIVSGPPPGLTLIGGYRFQLNEVERLITEADPNATLLALPDADLGQRFAGSSGDRAALRAKLDARGVNPLISGAFQSRGARDAA